MSNLSTKVHNTPSNGLNPSSTEPCPKNLESGQASLARRLANSAFENKTYNVDIVHDTDLYPKGQSPAGPTKPCPKNLESGQAILATNLDKHASYKETEEERLNRQFPGYLKRADLSCPDEQVVKH